MGDGSKWRGVQVFEEARNQVEDTLRRLFAPYTDGGSGMAPSWVPRVDLAENEVAYVVKADLPGIEPKDVDITLHQGVLRIRGERHEDREHKGTTFHKIERSIGTFDREIPLLGAVDADLVSATSSHGVIIINVPKKAGAMPKKITLNPGT